MPLTTLEVENPIHSRPANAIEAEQVVITVKSSLYRLEERIPTCIVVLDVSFDLGQDMGLAHAAVPLDLKVYEILSLYGHAPAARKAIHADCYLHDHFTGHKEETIIMDRYERHEITTIVPNVELGVANNLTAKFSNVGKTNDRTKQVEKGITLVGQSLKNNMQVKWVFGNKSKRHYPRNVRLMIRVKQTEKSRNPYFPFSLELGKKFKVAVFGGRFNDRVVKLFSRSRPLPICITGDWETDVAQKALTDVPIFYDDKETPQHIGLRATRRVVVTNT